MADKKSAEILSRVSQLSTGDKSDRIYDDWSQNYDHDLIDEFGYISPRVAAETLAAEVEGRDIQIIDYGCGTGLVGAALLSCGFKTIDGIDISSGMLQQAANKAIYRSLIQGDLTAGLSLLDDCYDAALCIGSMGAGHVGAEHVEEMLRPIKPGGYMVIVMNGIYFESGGFEQKFRELESDNIWRILTLEQFNYMSKLDRPGWLLVATRC